MAKFIVTYLTVIYVKYNFKKQTKKKKKTTLHMGLADTHLAWRISGSDRSRAILLLTKILKPFSL